MRNEITVGYEGIFRGEETKIPRINLEDAKLTFNARKAGPANFNDLRNGSYGEGFRMATMPELIHLIKNKDERIFEPMSEYGLSGNNIIIPIKTGIYIVDNPLKDQMDLNYLKCQLGDHEEGGVIFSRDKKIRFVQKGYTLGVQSLQDLIKNPVTIALAKGEKNASQLESIPDILKKENHYLWIRQEFYPENTNPNEIVGFVPNLKFIFNNQLSIVANNSPDFGNSYTFGVKNLEAAL